MFDNLSIAAHVFPFDITFSWWDIDAEVRKIVYYLLGIFIQCRGKWLHHVHNTFISAEVETSASCCLLQDSNADIWLGLVYLWETQDHQSSIRDSFGKKSSASSLF